MSISSDWQAISARVDALVTANHAYLAAFIRKSDDPYGGHNELVEEAIEIFEELKVFQSRYHSTLPNNASESLHHLFERRKDHFTPGKVSGFEGLKVLIPALAATRSAVDYHLRRGVKSPISSCSFKIDLGYSAYVANIKEWKYPDREYHIMNRGRLKFDGSIVAADKSRYS